MQNLFSKMLDILFPPSEDMLRVRTLSCNNIEALMNIRTQNDIISLLQYDSRDVRALVHETKFHGSRKATKLLAHVLTIYLSEKGASYDVMVPIPLSHKRKHERGFNQVEEILHETNTTIPIHSKVLTRTKHTVPQASLKREERLKNMKGVFEVRTPSAIQGKRVLIIDDVSTTGATLIAAKAALLPHKPTSITLLALAH